MPPPSLRSIGEEGRDGKLGRVAGRADGGKRIVHTQDPKFFIGVGMVKEFGARKYHQRNFLKAPGMAWSRVFDSMMGHIWAWWAGEELDPESSLHHLYHAGCNLEFLATYAANEVFHPGDDRPSKVEYGGYKYEDWESNFKRASEWAANPETVREILDNLKKEGQQS